MRRVRRLLGWLVAAWTAATLILAGWASMRGRPQDLPWTPLDPAQPIGLFTGAKLTRLGRDPAQCRALLDRAGIRYTVLPARHDGPRCGYDDGIRFTAGGSRRIAFAPTDLGVACPVAAALALWEWNVVQPAAQARFGKAVVRFEHFGSYNCRRIAGRDSFNWSEHATADAVDIAGFRFADGSRITVARDWRDPDQGAFLHDVRDGACKLFATTLSPDYNAAHADHLHLDQADRGSMGWRACR